MDEEAQLVEDIIEQASISFLEMLGEGYPEDTIKRGLWSILKEKPFLPEELKEEMFFKIQKRVVDKIKQN